LLRAESGRILEPISIASRIENFEYTAEGTLLSVRGPAQLIPTYETGPQPPTEALSGKVLHGVYHAMLREGSRDVLLVAAGVHILEFRGSGGGRLENLIGPLAVAPKYIATLQSTDNPQFPTQFESTPGGVVIVPQETDQAFFYDGEIVLPLGYQVQPGPPSGFGPETTDATPNDSGFVIDKDGGGISHDDFRKGRLGTGRSTDSAADAARLLQGSYQAAVQWIDWFGNQSPISPRSNAVTFDEQDAAGAAGPAANVQKQVVWTGLEPGPEGTIGRILYRTKDTVNAGTEKLFEVTGDAGPGGAGAFATIPDNSAKKWPDNVPDSWLVSEAQDVVLVPSFKLCRMAFGRLWIGNVKGDPAVIRPSRVNQFGTFDRDMEIVPDPNGAAITGLWAVTEGLLVFTETSTYIVQQSDTVASGVSFRSFPVHPTIGCVAPSTLANLQDGTVMWLGREGFYRFDGKNIALVSDGLRELTERINPARALQSCAVFDPRTREYRCWAPIDGSKTNNFCFVYDLVATEGGGWRRRTSEDLQAVTVTRDHRKYVMGLGTAEMTSGSVADLWVLDHEVRTLAPAAREARIETTWIKAATSKERSTASTVYLWFRETDDGNVTIDLYRDWRQGSAPTYTVTKALLRSPEDAPPSWGTAAYDEDTSEWVRRRPFWSRVDVYIPSCEVFKIVIRSQSRIEFIGLSSDEFPKTPRNARVPR
jgi:hypothetical protein